MLELVQALMPEEPEDAGRVSLGAVGVRSLRRVYLGIGAVVALVVAIIVAVVAFPGAALEEEEGAAPSETPQPVEGEDSTGVFRTIDIGLPVVVRGEELSSERAEATARELEPTSPVSVSPASVSPASVSPAEAPRRATSTTMSARSTKRVGSAPPPAPEPAPPPAPERSQTGAQYMADARRHVGRTYHGEVQECFRAGMRVAPDLTGRVVIAMVMHATGQVASSRVVSNSTGAVSVGQCVADRARGWRLPEPPPRTLELRLAFSI
ncbi:MAG: AgmX/PglI C-terminal domain-containing protein [Myxococcota bacterium]